MGVIYSELCFGGFMAVCCLVVTSQITGSVLISAIIRCNNVGSVPERSELFCMVFLLCKSLTCAHVRACAYVHVCICV